MINKFDLLDKALVVFLFSLNSVEQEKRSEIRLSDYINILREQEKRIRESEVKKDD